MQAVSRLFKFHELDTLIIKALKTEEAIANFWSALVMMQPLNWRTWRRNYLFLLLHCLRWKKNFVTQRKTFLPTFSKINNMQKYPYLHANIDWINFYSWFKTVNPVGSNDRLCSSLSDRWEHSCKPGHSNPLSTKDCPSHAVISTRPIFPF